MERVPKPSWRYELSKLRDGLQAVIVHCVNKKISLNQYSRKVFHIVETIWPSVAGWGAALQSECTDTRQRRGREGE
jgi:hypothetical protein